MKLIFLHGLPGVGKLTVADELAKLTGFKLFHNHLAVDLVESVFEFGSHPFVELREKVWLAVFSQAATARLDGLIFTFAWDRTVRVGFIEDLRTAVESDEGKVLFVQLKCRMEELEKRITHPSRRQFGKLNSVDGFRELREAGAFVGPAIHEDAMTLDITEIPPGESAGLIVSALGL